MISTHDIDLHFNSAVNLKTGLVFKAGDKGLTFNLHIKDLNPLGMYGKIAFHRPNNTSVEGTLVGSGREYTYTILGNEFAVPGVVIVDVKFYDALNSPNQRISTTSFVIGVISDTLDGLGGGTAGYSDELEVLRAAMEQAEQGLLQAQQDYTNMSTLFGNTLQAYIDAFGNTAPINPRGYYDPTEPYNPRDAVTYNGVLYMCYITAAAGTLPTNTNFWQEIGTDNDELLIKGINVGTPLAPYGLATNNNELIVISY